MELSIIEVRLHWDATAIAQQLSQGFKQCEHPFWRHNTTSISYKKHEYLKIIISDTKLRANQFGVRVHIIQIKY